MKTVTVLFLVIGLLVVGAVVPKQADAACAQTVYAERAYTNGSVTYVFGRVLGTHPYFFQASTTNVVMANMIFNAVSQRNRLYIYGSGTCPSSYSAGVTYNLGTIGYMYQQP